MGKTFLFYIKNFLGYSVYSWGLLDNLDNIKGFILAILGGVFTYYKIREQIIVNKGKDLDNQLKKRDLNKHYPKKDKEIKKE